MQKSFRSSESIYKTDITYIYRNIFLTHLFLKVKKHNLKKSFQNDIFSLNKEITVAANIYWIFICA